MMQTDSNLLGEHIQSTQAMLLGSFWSTVYHSRYILCCCCQSNFSSPEPWFMSHMFMVALMRPKQGNQRNKSLKQFLPKQAISNFEKLNQRLITSFLFVGSQSLNTKWISVLEWRHEKAVFPQWPFLLCFNCCKSWGFNGYFDTIQF